MVNPGIFFMNSRMAYLLRTREDGTREASWRMWLLIFVTPGLFLLAAGFLAFESLSFASGAKMTTGEVVRVYHWDGWNPWDGATVNHSPVFRYTFTDGSTTEASTGQSSPNWNFAEGSRHEILFRPGRKGDVKLNTFEALWALPLTILLIGLATLLPALIAATFLLRWLRGGAGPQPS